MKAEKIEKPGKSFEAEVESMFKLLGYETQRNIESDGNEIDIYAELASGLCKQHVAVECKDLARNVTVKKISEFCSVFVTLRARNKVDMGLIVARADFSPNALNKAEAEGVSCLSYSDLAARLLDFTRYLTQFVYDYESFDEYSMGQRKSIVDMMQRCDLRRFYIDLRCFDMNGKVYDAIDLFIEDWLTYPKP